MRRALDFGGPGLVEKERETPPGFSKAAVGYGLLGDEAPRAPDPSAIQGSGRIAMPDSGRGS